jgi:TIR domain
MTVIISYRRDDTGAITGRICDRLRARFGAEKVYMDIDSNPIGVDYRSHIDESLKRSDILLAVIGRRWLGRGDFGNRRIDEPTDLVRLEVTSALTRGIRVVPLLVDDTEMPSAEELPEDLRGLKFRQAFRVDSGIDFHHHLDRLCDAIAAAAPGSVAATVSPPPIPKSPPTNRVEREAAATVSPPTLPKSLPTKRVEREVAATVSPPTLPKSPPTKHVEPEVPATVSPPTLPKSPPAKRVEREAPRDIAPKPPELVRLPQPTSNKLRLSKFAIASLICSGPGPCVSFLFNAWFHWGSPVGAGFFAFSMVGLSGAAVVFGQLARKQIQRNPSLSANGFATAGLILGSVELLFAIIAIIAGLAQS